MTLAAHLEIQRLTLAADYFEYHHLGNILPTRHPPSLKNPEEVPQYDSRAGWHPNDSPKEKARARADLVESLKRTYRQMRQTRAVARGANYPVHPTMQEWR